MFNRPYHLLFVDDRPITFTEVLFRRTDVRPILLRFRQILHELPPSYVEATSEFPSFVVDLDAPIAAEVERFKVWQTQKGITATHFFNPSEPRQYVAHRFARMLDLDALSEEQVRWLRHKPSMKVKLKALGMQVAQHEIVSSHRDIMTFAQTYGWPVILKPTESFACINTYKLNNPLEVMEVDLSIEKEWMVECFVTDKEYECCALIYAGRVMDIYLSYFPAPPLEIVYGAINANITMRHLPDKLASDVRALIQQIVDGMGLDHGYMHLELFIADQRYTLSEVALRLAGCEIPANHGLAFGFSIFDDIIDIYTGRPPRLNYMNDRCVGDLLLPISPGYVSDMTSLDELLTMEGVIGGKFKVRVGDTISPRRASHYASGYLHIQGSTPFEVEARMKAVLNVFRFKTVAVPEGEIEP